MLDWAKIGLPVGAIIMAIFFIILMILTLGFNAV
jgi:predicted cation transporter